MIILPQQNGVYDQTVRRRSHKAFKAARISQSDDFIQIKASIAFYRCKKSSLHVNYNQRLRNKKLCPAHEMLFE